MFRAAVVLLMAGAATAAQIPRIENADLRMLSAGSNWRQTLADRVGQAVEPVWIGYSVPKVEGKSRLCCSNSGGCSGCCALEGGSTNIRSDRPAGPVRLEAGQRLVVFVRASEGKVGKVRVYSDDCEVDAGGRTVYWLAGAKPGESVRFLSSLAGENSGKETTNGAIMAIAHHAGSEADRALERLASSEQPLGIRKKSAFWLGSVRGRHGFEVVRKLVRDDEDDEFRKHAVFALNISHEPEALDEMIALARNDESPRVRKAALFWLSQKAGRKAAETITERVSADPESQVKKHAVFALSRLPPSEGLPLLIKVARTNKDPDVRKKAIFWLGQSKDRRALEFFEEVLGR